MRKTSKQSLFEEDEGAAALSTEPTLRVNEGYAARFEVGGGMRLGAGAMPAARCCRRRHSHNGAPLVTPCTELCAPSAPLPTLRTPLQHNKKREELHRLKEKYPEEAARISARARVNAEDGGDDDESDSEEEDDGYIPDRKQAQIFETLLKIRAKDPSVYDADAKFYSSSSEDEDEEGGDGDGDEGGEGKKAAAAAAKKERPMYLKDLHYQQAMEGGGASSSEEEDAAAGAGRRRGPAVKTYGQEQEELKGAFLQAFEEEVGQEAAAAAGGDGEDEFGGVLKRRHKPQRDDAEGGAGEGQGGGEEARVQALLNGYFGADDALPEGDRFLKSYILNKVRRAGRGRRQYGRQGRRRQYKRGPKSGTKSPARDRMQEEGPAAGALPVQAYRLLP